MSDMPTPNHWSLDKRIPLGLVLAVIIQTLVLGGFIGKLDSRVATIEGSRFTQADGARHEERIRNNAANIDKLEARTIRALDDIKKSLDNIERAVRSHEDWEREQARDMAQKGLK